jgi:hypothetical protein
MQHLENSFKNLPYIYIYIYIRDANLYMQVTRIQVGPIAELVFWMFWCHVGLYLVEKAGSSMGVL